MTKELIINSTSSEVDIAFIENKQLVELHREKNNNKYTVGDVYLGKVRRVMPGLNAAFVNVGYKKDAFLHYLDLGPQINSINYFTKKSLSKKSKFPFDELKLKEPIKKTGKITDVLSVNQQILVQISKEPISTKGPRVSSEISLAGRYIVLVPFSNRISVSQKIKNIDEKNRLKRLIKSIKPDNFGVIIRTVAEEKSVADLDADLKKLMGKWDSLATALPTAVNTQRILSEVDRTSVLLRDLLNESFNAIYVNDNILYEEIRKLIKSFGLHKSDIVKLYKGKSPIFEYYDIEKKIKSSFGKTVTIKSGIYLIIEHTEALHVIDVNSGHHVNSGSADQEKNAFEVNLESATEIARQLRLRDMGGIIVIDFIDMHLAGNRKMLYEKMRDEMKRDRAKHTILPVNKFGLIQITRQRVRPETNIEVFEKCPVCGGSGKITPSIFLIEKIEDNIKYLILNQNEKHLKLIVHPFIYSFLTKGIFSYKTKWFFKFKKRIKLKENNSYHFLEYNFFNKKDDEIKIAP